MPPRLVPILLATALALGSVGVAAGPASAAGAVDQVAVTATKDHHLHLRTHLQAGVVEFTVVGAKQENLQLAQAKGGAGPAQLAADGNALSRTGKPAGIEHDFTALGGVRVGHSLWLRLAPGTYFAIDTNGEKATASQVVTLHVDGTDDGAGLPSAGATITAVHEMSWAEQPARIPSSGVLRFENSSSEYHFVELARLKDPSTTLAQLRTLLKTNEESKADERWVYDTGVLSPHESQLSGYHLKPGTYALLCWWPDEHGVPHALMGMARLVHVG